MAAALWTASSLGQAEEVRRMAADGADINQRGGPDAGSSPLYIAASQGHVEVVTVLLEAGAATQFCAVQFSFNNVNTYQSVSEAFPRTDGVSRWRGQHFTTICASVMSSKIMRVGRGA